MTNSELRLPGVSSSRQRSPAKRWLDARTPLVRHAFRRLVVVVCLLPLVGILAREAPHLAQDPLVLGYGFAVLSGTIAMLFIAYARYDDPSQRELLNRPLDIAGFPALGQSPSVSLLVAVKDEAGTISQCVSSMVGTQYDNLEVIVVDDGSTDGTTDILRSLQSHLNFNLIVLERNQGKKHALTRGTAVARGQVLAFTDSDCVLAPDALPRCVEALVRHPELGAVSGHARALNANATLLTRMQDVWYEGQFRVMKAAESTFGSVTCVSGPMAVFRREAIYNYMPAWANDRFLGGEFRFATDRQLTGYVLGQRWLGRKLKDKYATSPFVAAVDYPERLWRVGYVNSSKVWTNVPSTIRAFYRQQIRWKKSFIRNLCFNGRFMWRRGLGPALLYYGHVLWVLAAPVMAVRHLIWAPLHGLWFLMFLYLCGVTLKGTVYGIAYHFDNPRDPNWCLRPLMSLLSSLTLSWLLVYSAATIRRGIWARQP
jgi:cellulose synthase/poly-beta-1,6-N-acetylglucosamine synthase-like glycosyltransferase